MNREREERNRMNDDVSFHSETSYHREPPPPKTPPLERVELPEFKGKFDPDEFPEWLSIVERIFEIQEVDEARKCKLVILRLKGYASSAWWGNIEASSRVRNGKEKIRDWDKMKKEKKKLRKRFVPKTYLQDTYAKFHDLTQGNLSVEEYTRVFEELSM